MTPAEPSPRPAVWEWAQTALLAINLAWTTLCLGGYLPETVVVTGVLTGLLLTVHLLERACGHPDPAGRAGAKSGKRLSPELEAGSPVAAVYDRRGTPLPPVGGHRPPLQNTVWAQRDSTGSGWEGSRLHPAGWVLLPFVVYGAANVLFVTPVPWLGWGDWLGWARMVVVFWVVLNGVRSPAPRAVLFGTLLALATVGVALGCYQRFADPEWLMLGRRQAAQFLSRASGCFGIPNSLAALLVLFLPAVGALAARPGVRVGSRVLFGGLAAFFAFGLLLTISRGGWLALGLSLAAWPLCAGRAPLARRLGRAAGVGALGMAAVGALYFAAPPVRARLDALVSDAGERTRPILWRGAMAIFREHPLWGGGAGSFNVLFEKHRPARFQDEPQWAHNDYLNTLADYGAVGFVLFFGACGAMIWRCRRSRSPENWGQRAPLSEPSRGASLLRPPRGEGRSKTAPLQNTPRAAAVSAPVAAVYDRRDRPDSESAVIDRRYSSTTAFLAHPWVEQGLAVGLLAFALQLFVDFHFKLPALAMAFALCAGLLVAWRWPVARTVGPVPATEQSEPAGPPRSFVLAQSSSDMGGTPMPRGTGVPPVSLSDSAEPAGPPRSFVLAQSSSDMGGTPMLRGTGVPPVSLSDSAAKQKTVDGSPAADNRPAGVGGRVRLAYGAAALGVLAATLFVILPQDRAEALRYGAREAIDRLARPEAPPTGQSVTRARAQDAFARAVALDPGNAQAWADLSYALSLWTHEEPARTVELGREAEIAARRALALTAVLPEAWVRLGVALDMQDRWVEAGQYFARAVELAPAVVNIRYYYAYHLSLRPVTQALARAMADACLLLDPSHRAAQALRQQLATSPNAR